MKKNSIKRKAFPADQYFSQTLLVYLIKVYFIGIFFLLFFFLPKNVYAEEEKLVKMKPVEAPAQNVLPSPAFSLSAVKNTAKEFKLPGIYVYSPTLENSSQNQNENGTRAEITAELASNKS